LDAEVLLRHVLGLDRTQLFIRLRDPLPAQERAKLDALVDRRLAGEPIAYLTGSREFMGLTFAVGPGVLVPRPETEVLVEWALRWLGNRHRATVVDVGTGSGAIALSIAAMRQEESNLIFGVDRSADALRYAARNRDALGLIDRVHLVLGDLLTWCKGPVDLILANLPYLRPEQRAGNADLRAEPEFALTSGPDGLTAIRRLLTDVPRLLADGGAVALEIDPSQVGVVQAITRSTLPAARISVLHDLAGLDRVVVAER
jgi:release factor glutamine methyltransferase